jgi:hypothetical protein
LTRRNQVSMGTVRPAHAAARFPWEQSALRATPPGFHGNSPPCAPRRQVSMETWPGALGEPRPARARINGGRGKRRRRPSADPVAWRPGARDATLARWQARDPGRRAGIFWRDPARHSVEPPTSGRRQTAWRAAALSVCALGRRQRSGLSVGGLMPIVGALAAALVIDAGGRLGRSRWNFRCWVGAKLTFVREQR